MEMAGVIFREPLARPSCRHSMALYEIVSRHHNLVPSYFEYHIKFEDIANRGTDQ